MKKLVLLIVILCVIFGGYLLVKQVKHDIEVQKETKSNSKTNTQVVDDLVDNLVKTPEDSNEKSNKSNTVSDDSEVEDEKITQDEAIKLAQNEFGTVDEMSKNKISYAYMTNVKDSDGVEYYAFRQSFFVDGEHMSFLQYVFVSFDGKKIETNSQSLNLEEGQVVDFD